MQEQYRQVVHDFVRVARVAQVPDRLEGGIHRAELDCGVGEIAPGDAVAPLRAEVVHWNVRVRHDFSRGAMGHVNLDRLRIRGTVGGTLTCETVRQCPKLPK